MENELEMLKEMTDKEAEVYVLQQEEKLLAQGSNWFLPNHIVEVYLYEYYLNQNDIKVGEIPLHKMYQILAERSVKEEEYSRAEQYLQKAYEYNPVDIEIQEELGRVYRRKGNWERMHQIARTMYPFCYTKRDIASYYRLNACYHLETYEPEKALQLYAYSNLFYQHPEADADIKYLEAAMQEKIKEFKPDELQSLIKAQQYPIQPKEETLGILYQTALSELRSGNLEYAGILLVYLEQLTGDEEIKKVLSTLNAYS